MGTACGSWAIARTGVLREEERYIGGYGEKLACLAGRRRVGKSYVKQFHFDDFLSDTP